MESDQTSDTGGKASTAFLSKVTVTSNQARLVAEQVLFPSTIVTATSTGAASNQQDLILAELQRISQRFGKLEDQTNQGRIILKGLMNQIRNQQNNPTVTSESNVSPISHSVHNVGPLQPTTSNTSQQILINPITSSHVDTSVRPKTYSVQASVTNLTGQPPLQSINTQHHLQQDNDMNMANRQLNTITAVTTGNMGQNVVTPVTFTSQINSNTCVIPNGSANGGNVNRLQIIPDTIIHQQYTGNIHSQNTDYSSLLHNSSLIFSAAQQTHTAGQQHWAHHTATRNRHKIFYQVE